MSVYGKIHAVMNEVASVDKDGKLDAGRQSYNYRSAEALFGVIRAAMKKHALILLPQCDTVDTVREDGVGWYVCHYTMTFVDAEDDSSVSLPWKSSVIYERPGYEGKVTLDDKAMNKAHTYAMKYFLSETFLITSNEDDPDSEPAPVVQRQQQRPQRSAPANGKPKSNAQPFSGLPSAAPVVDEVVFPATPDGNVNKAEPAVAKKWLSEWQQLGIAYADVVRLLGCKKAVSEYAGTFAEAQSELIAEWQQRLPMDV